MKHYYKKILIVFFFSLQFSFLNAQYVQIDPNFAFWLTSNGYSSCFNGNGLDTTCNYVLSAKIIAIGALVNNVTNLDGLQYFDSLESFSSVSTPIDTIPGFPNSLKYIYLINCSFSTLPKLPDSLQVMYCYYSDLDLLPSLPSKLEYLEVSHDNLMSLPNLPASLRELYVQYNQIDSMPALPNKLKILDCSYNNFPNLPLLPDSLEELYCNVNNLSFVPLLPDSLKIFYCNNNLLSTVPILPSGLTSLRCNNNQLSALPLLPNVLQELDCSQNTAITSLPALPDSLKIFRSNNNFLNQYPSLPSGLTEFAFSGNLFLQSVPTLPNSLTIINASDCPISSLPELPDSLHDLYLNNDINLYCLPELKRIQNLYFTNTSVSCLPNYGNVTNSTPPLSSLPLCDLFNPNGCTVYWNISGKAYVDTNNNCIAETNELRLPNMKLMLDSAGTLIQQTYTGGEGLYSFDTDTGTYTYTVDTTDLPVMVTCPVAGFQTSVLTAVDSMDYGMDFGMQCKPGFDVGATSVARDSGVFRPANFARVKISAGDISNFYGLHCAAGTSGSVQVVFNGAVSYIGATAGALTPVVSGDTLLYSIADFGTVNFNADLSFTMQTDTTAPLGSQVCFDVNVTPTAGDINPANNSLQHCFTVVNSIDPNTKEVFPKGNIDTSQHWLTYTINFQNTGTAPAQHIYILDTLDNNLDESSFTLLAYNHQPLTQVNGKVIRFNFPNINLPDSTNDEPNSHGYVQYKVKLKTGLTNGTLIHNTAHIVFDFNAPVITNTVTNQVHITTGTDNFQFSTFNFQFLPNPFHHSTLLKISSSIKSGNYNLEIYDVLGNKVREINTHGKNEIIIERKNLEAGIYIFKLFNEKELVGTGKLVVE